MPFSARVASWWCRHQYDAQHHKPNHVSTYKPTYRLECASFIDAKLSNQLMFHNNGCALRTKTAALWTFMILVYKQVIVHSQWKHTFILSQYEEISR